MASGKTMHLAVSLLSAAAEAQPGSGLDFAGLARLVQKAETAGLDMVLVADSAPAAGGDGPNGQMPFEATTLLAALATVTSRIGLVAAASTIAHQPYNLARRFASLDIISHGRIGWHAAMAPNSREAANFSRPEGFSPENFRRRAEEYIGIVQGLWRGWDADALLFDQAGGRFHDPEKMRVLDHKGAYFSVRGPLNVARSPQDAPVLVLSGLPEPDLDIAVRMADVILVDEASVERAKARFSDLKRRIAACGRDAHSARVLMTIALDGTTPPTASADSLEELFRSKSCDGFNILIPPQAGAVDNFSDRVLPELRRRGLFRLDYEGTTLRSHLGLAGGGHQ
ncbi:LLM class flavin-dependent oxidoreductase [Mesorhizobium sp. INR15]|nr:LLM class flavin-dependent oxidoreductase [Mesorhizobium sp. INR15]